MNNLYEMPNLERHLKMRREDRTWIYKVGYYEGQRRAYFISAGIFFTIAAVAVVLVIIV